MQSAPSAKAEQDITVRKLTSDERVLVKISHNNNLCVLIEVRNKNGIYIGSGILMHSERRLVYFILSAAHWYIYF